jgi:hypothetical protein
VFAKQFLAHLAKGNVSFCHHLASVVHRLLTRHILMFSSKTTKPNELKRGFIGDFFKSTNQKQELPVAAMFASGSGPNV